MVAHDAIVARILAGNPVDVATLDDDSLAALLDDPRGRRWLRAWPGLDPCLADRLLDWPEDYAARRRDSTLERVVALATLSALEARADALARGSAALAFWRRLAVDPDRLTAVAVQVVVGDAAEAALAILILDPLDELGLGVERRVRVASAALASASPAARGLAVEYLATASPASVVERLGDLASDPDERVRGVAWLTSFRVAAGETFDRAVAVLSDESLPIEQRRSALVAAGTALPTSQVVDVLSLFVVHPDERLALDAADLLYAQHRNPITAEAALLSPHAKVRDIAAALLDPRRGSPAAGGSRPGDPTRAIDIFTSLLERGDAPGANGSPRR